MRVMPGKSPRSIMAQTACDAFVCSETRRKFPTSRSDVATFTPDGLFAAASSSAVAAKSTCAEAYGRPLTTRGDSHLRGIDDFPRNRPMDACVYLALLLLGRYYDPDSTPRITPYAQLRE